MANHDWHVDIPQETQNSGIVTKFKMHCCWCDTIAYCFEYAANVALTGSHGAYVTQEPTIVQEIHDGWDDASALTSATCTPP